MTKKLFSLVVLMGISVSAAQAITLTHTDTYTTTNDIQSYFFDVVGGTGDVTIISDTLTDGFDHEMNLWIKEGNDWRSGTPGGEWWSSGSARDPDSVNNGLNIFGVQLKNGWVQGDITQQGTSDPGISATLAPGSYLLTSTDNANFNQGSFGGLLSDGWTNQGNFETHPFFNGPHDYQITVTGDFVQAAAVVPVPAAVWLFGTALAGLGAARRKKTV